MAAVKYGFVGRQFWGARDKDLTAFKKAFARQIPPAEMKDAFALIKKEYKELSK